ncbi:armadillo-type protein [Mycena leptocephala]|nr:armadillo-type protein [Mycena leptocephala]
MSLRTPSPSADLATRETRSLCNRLAESNFDSIASQILALVNGSAGEGDCKTLFVVIEVCVRSAVSQPERSGLYARLCRRLMEDISPEVHADVSGQSIGGPQLFRKVLLNRLQGDFETGYLPSPPGVECTKKRTYLGLVRFLTEIFKVQMLTERIMHECIKKALQTLEYPLEDDMEAVYILLHFAGSLLDSLKARPHMDVYFSRLRELTLDGKIPNRIRFMFQDLCDLRTRKWIPLDKGYSEDIILVRLP